MKYQDYVFKIDTKNLCKNSALINSDPFSCMVELIKMCQKKNESLKVLNKKIKEYFLFTSSRKRLENLLKM